MFETHWLALGALSVLLTLAWLFIEIRVTTTSFMSFVSWSLMALTGGDVERITNDGTTVQAAATPELRYLLFAFGLLSLLAFILYQIGAYPPEDNSPYHETQS